ncbi:MAG: RAD55 family ATPase [Haloarculaceae archaeon]
MSQRREQRYEFEGVPIDPVPLGTNVLVAGPALGGIRELLLQLLVGGEDEGTLFISADVSASEVLADFEQAGGRQTNVRIVDCSQGEETADTDRVKTITSPGDLTGIGMQFSALYEGLYADGIERVRTGIYTLTPLLVYSEDVRSIYRFLHTITGRIRAADGLGVCAIDPTAQDDRTLSSIAQAFDCRLDLRENGKGHEIRMRGMESQSGDWRAFDPRG